MLTHLLYRLPVFWSIIYIYIYCTPWWPTDEDPIPFYSCLFQFLCQFHFQSCFCLQWQFIFYGHVLLPDMLLPPADLQPVENLRRIGTGYSDLVRILSSDRCCLWAAVFNMKLQPPTRQCVCISDMWVKQSLLYLHDHTLKIHCRSLFR